MLFSHGPNKAFLVPDPCRAMVKKGNSTNKEFTEDTIENIRMRSFQIFSDNLVVDWTF